MYVIRYSTYFTIPGVMVVCWPVPFDVNQPMFRSYSMFWGGNLLAGPGGFLRVRHF